MVDFRAFPPRSRLQRKVLWVVVVIILVPMLVTGSLTAAWIVQRFETSIEGWVRDAAQLERDELARLHANARLLADVMEQVTPGLPELRHGISPIPARLAPLAQQLGITLVQVYDPAGGLLYSSNDARLDTAWAPSQDTAVLRVEQGGEQSLAAVTILRVPDGAEHHYRLVLGTLFDKSLLERLGRASGLKTRLFYPRAGGFAKAFADPADDQNQALALRLPAAAYAELQAHRDYFSTTAEEGRYVGLYSPVVDATGRVEAVLFSGLERHRGLALLTDQGGLTLVIALLGGLLAGAAGLLLGRLVVRPVTSLREAVARLAAQDFSAAIPVRSGDELGELAQAFNGMAQRLRHARDEQRRAFQREKLSALGELSLAMAHEIRNPVGVITTASRLLESSRDPEQVSQLQHMIHEESQRIDQLLKDFQQLARHRAPRLVEIDPSGPLEQALEMLLIGRDGVRVERDYKHGRTRVCGDPELLRQLWMILIRNALDVLGADTGTLWVDSRLGDGVVDLSLQDSGPGIPLEQMLRLFEPFYTTKAGGSGLGLTIAATLAEANGAQLELVPPPAQPPADQRVRSGAHFALRLQRPSEEPR